MKRIGILTAGGDTPALNATIHGAVVRANQLKVEVYGLIKGFNCLFNPRVPHVHLNPLYQEIPELDPTKGGTLIGSATGSGGRGGFPPLAEGSPAPEDGVAGRATGGFDLAHAPKVMAMVTRTTGTATRPMCMLRSLLLASTLLVSSF